MIHDGIALVDLVIFPVGKSGEFICEMTSVNSKTL